MPIPQGLEFLSQQLDALLGSEYQALSAAFHALQTKEGQPALKKDEHRTHLATLSSLIPANDPSLISESVMVVVRECLPSYHFQYEGTREASIRLAVEKVAAAITYVSSSHWSQRNLALKELTAIQQGYEAALSVGAEQIQTRVPVAILEEGYYSLDVATARRLLCIDAEGKEYRENSSGAHAVCAANGIHYKPDPSVVIGDQHRDITPIAPEKEYAVSTLIQYIAGNQLAAAPTGLLIIQDVPLDGFDAHRTTGGLVQAGLSIQGMCFKEFFSLREALRFFKRTIGEAALIRILEDGRRGYSEFLALARAEFPEVFAETPDLTEAERAARAASFRRCFDRISEKMAIEECFEEIQEAHVLKISESKRVFIFREMYNNCAHNLSALPILLALTRTYPELMSGQSIVSSVRLLALLPTLFQLFPKQSAAQAIVDIERVLTDYLDKEATSALWVGLLLSLPQDAKLDNFRLQLIYDKEGHLERCRIVSIDNDLSLGMPFMQVIWQQFDAPRLGVTIKNSLYWLPELLEQPIDPQVRARLLASPARSQWLTWLCLVARRNEEHGAWQQQGVLSQKEAARFLMKLPERNLKFILTQWEKLQTVLRADPEMTHAALLNALYPTVVAAYDVIGQEIRAQKKDANIQDYDEIVNQMCASYGYYLLSIEPKEGIAEHEGEICRAYEQDFSGSQQEVLPQGMVEISQYVLNILRTENWAKQADPEHWFLLQAFSLLRNSTRLDWEEGMPLGQKQVLWQRWLVAAIERGSIFMVRYLLSLGASVGIPKDESLKTPLHYFCEVYLSYPNLATVTTMAEVLLSHHSCQPNAYDAMGNTPLLQWANVKRPEELEALQVTMAERVLAALCMQGADINLLDGQVSRSVLDKMAKRDNVQGFILVVAYGAKECRNRQAVLEWCDTHLSASEKQGVFNLLKQRSVTWAWWLSLPEWQLREGGRPVQGVSSGMFALPSGLWQAWKQAAFKVAAVAAESAGKLTVEPAKYGRRSVKSVQYKGAKLHIKPDPELFLVEFAVAALLNGLFGDLVAPSDCLAIMDDKKQVHPALFSQTVVGETLCDALKNVGRNAYHHTRLDKRQTSAQILGAMLIHPEDGRSDNYMLVEHILADGLEANRIFAIDNDHAFVNPVAKDGTLQVKSILFCLTFMHEPVHPVWRDRIIGLSIEQFLQDLFKEIEGYQTKANHIFDKGTRLRFQNVGAKNQVKGFFGLKDAKLPVVITFPLDEDAVIALWDRLTQLQSILRHTPTITHLALLNKLSPPLGKLYSKAFEEIPSPDQTEVRFQYLCAKFYEIQGQTPRTTVDVLKAMCLPEKQQKAIDTQDESQLFTPTKALKTLDRLSIEYMRKGEILKELYADGYSEKFVCLESKALQIHIVNELDFRRYVQKAGGIESKQWDIQKQENALRCIADAKIPFTRLVIMHCAALMGSHLAEILASAPGLVYLKLVDCPNLSNGFFKQVLGEYGSNLIALTIVQCHGLTESEWGFFKPTFGNLERVRIEDNLQLQRISLDAPRLKRLQIDKNPQLFSYINNGNELIQRDALGRTPLLQAVANGDIQRVDYLLSRYSEHGLFEQRDFDGNTPLLIAVKTAQGRMGNHLLTHYSAKVSFSEKDGNGDTALFWAVKKQDTIILDWLLEDYPQKTSLAERDANGDTPLLWAVKYGEYQIMLGYLLKKYPEKVSFSDRDKDGDTPLFWAVKNNTFILNHLLSHYPKQISLFEKDKDGNTPLFYAAKQVLIFEKDKDINVISVYPDMKNERKAFDCLLMHHFRQGIIPGKDQDGNTLLFWAVKNDSFMVLNEISAYRTCRISPVEKDNDGNTPLSWAIENGKLKVIDYLLKEYREKSLLSEKDQNGDTPLFLAVKNEKYFIIGCLLKYYPQHVWLTEKNKDGRVILFLAEKTDWIVITDRILHHDLERILSEIKDKDGNTALLWAIKERQIEVIDHLLQHYPDQISLAEKDNDGRSILRCAEIYGRHVIVEHLISHYSDQILLAEKSSDGNIALFWVVENGKTDMLDHLLKNYPDQVSLAEKNQYGFTVLFWVVKNGKTEMLDHLLKNYPNKVSLAEKDEYGDTVLFCAVKNGKTEMLDHLLQHYPEQVSLAEKDKWGYTVLFRAVKSGEADMFDHLLRHYPEQVSLAEKNKYGYSFLFGALLSGATKMVEHVLLNYSDQIFLVENGDDVITTLFLAVEHNRHEMTKHLLSFCAKNNLLTKKDRSDRTILLYAAAKGDVAMVEYLLSNYPELSLAETDDKGCTALMLAKKNGKEEMVAYLMAKCSAQPSSSEAPQPYRLSLSPLAFNARPVEAKIEQLSPLRIVDAEDTVLADEGESVEEKGSSPGLSSSL